MNLFSSRNTTGALLIATAGVFAASPASADEERHRPNDHRPASSHSQPQSSAQARPAESRHRTDHRNEALRHSRHNAKPQGSEHHKHDSHHNRDSKHRRPAHAWPPHSSHRYSRHNHRHHSRDSHYRHRPYYNPFAWQPPPRFRTPRYSVHHAYDLAWDRFGLNVERTLYEHGHWILFGFSAVHGPLRVVIDSANGILLSYHSSRYHH